MTDPIRQAAENVVSELALWLDPDRDSEYNTGPYPDPVAALVAFADAVTERHCHCPDTPITHYSDCQPGGRSFQDWDERSRGNHG